MDSDGFMGDKSAVSSNTKVALAGDGSRVAFSTYATNLVDDDTNGLVDAFVHDICPISTTDLGAAKEGSNGFVPAFQVCGNVADGETALFRVRQGPALQIALVAYSLTYAPVDIWDGTLVPGSPFFFGPFPTDAEGSLDFSVTLTDPTPAEVYVQWLVTDPGASYGLVLSNALLVPLNP